MKFVIQPISVGEHEGFEKDVLGRKKFGESLLNLVSISNDELVISLDGKWGEGKTTFVKMWKGMLTQKGIPNIYVDSFANDYSDDAFLAIASAITAYIEERNVNSDDLNDFKENAKKVGGQLLSLATKIGIRAFISGAIEVGDFKELRKDLKNIKSTMVDDFVGEKLESHKKDIEFIQSFKKLMSEIPTLLNSNNKPLVIIIDELDRCKPTYAVDIIEKVKHLFSVKNVVFVLVMHRGQLEESVKCVYGRNIDARTYLQKFINIETAIPKRIGGNHVSDIEKYNKILFDSHQINTWGDGTKILEFLKVLANHFNLSLRELERVYTNLAVFYASLGERYLRVIPILSFLAVIKVREPSVYEALLYKRITYEELCQKIGLLDVSEEQYTGIMQEQNIGTLQFISLYLNVFLITEDQFDLLYNQIYAHSWIRILMQSLRKHNVQREELIPMYIQESSIFIVA